MREQALVHVDVADEENLIERARDFPFRQQINQRVRALVVERAERFVEEDERWRGAALLRQRGKSKCESPCCEGGSVASVK